MAEAKRPYLSYLLRLWQADGAEPMWRASLESVGTGARHGFATLEALFDFLEAETKGLSAEEARNRATERLAAEAARQDETGGEEIGTDYR